MPKPLGFIVFPPGWKPCAGVPGREWKGCNAWYYCKDPSWCYDEQSQRLLAPQGCQLMSVPPRPMDVPREADPGEQQAFNAHSLGYIKGAQLASAAWLSPRSLARDAARSFPAPCAKRRVSPDAGLQASRAWSGVHVSVALASSAAGRKLDESSRPPSLTPQGACTCGLRRWCWRRRLSTAGRAC
jgi:hypothetical protein